ncbi:MAG: hypothetical protein B7Y82_13360 [Sphingomonadales bacterium 32-65-25]|nr:MAG: hypothetical protein B7Y82_13360 [Sphingomonadales bacterium 32-65-25]
MVVADSGLLPPPQPAATAPPNAASLIASRRETVIVLSPLRGLVPQWVGSRHCAVYRGGSD